MPCQPKLTGETERAGQSTPDLRRDANCVSAFLGNIYSLSKFAVLQSHEIAPRSVDRIEPPMDRRQLDIPFFRKRNAGYLRQIRHQLEIIEGPLINTFIDLCSPERRIKDRGQFSLFVVEEKFHGNSGSDG